MKSARFSCLVQQGAVFVLRVEAAADEGHSARGGRWERLDWW